jgi:isopenicillin N synthase-like dioxygenase
MIPIIDIAPLISKGTKQHSAITEIRKACETIGFFYVIGHGISRDVQVRILSTAKEFFALPQSIKRSVDVAKSRCFRGYVPLALTGPNVPKRMLEAFQMMLDLGPDDPDVATKSIMYGANQWPENSPRMREILEAYFKEMGRLSNHLLSLFAYALGEDPGVFSTYYQKPLTQLRLLHYPYVDSENLEDQRGVEAHTDTGAFTILMQDETGGLEIQTRDGTWLAAPTVTDTFIINVGDMMQWWTADRFISTPHRVTNRSGHSRYSVPFFVNPDRNAVIARLGSDPENPSAIFDVGAHVEKAYVDAWPRDPAGVG